MPAFVSTSMGFCPPPVCSTYRISTPIAETESARIVLQVLPVPASAPGTPAPAASIMAGDPGAGLRFYVHIVLIYIHIYNHHNNFFWINNTYIYMLTIYIGLHVFILSFSNPLRVLRKARQIVRESNEQCHVDKGLGQYDVSGF